MSSTIEPATPSPAPYRSPTDKPIPLWPDTVVGLVAGALLLYIGLRHKDFLARKAREAQKALDSFQQQGAVDDVVHLAKQAAALFKAD